MHGGRVEATSEGHGRGSTFTIRLPAASRSAGTAEKSDSAPRIEKRGARILVVDDNADMASSLMTLLQLIGNEVEAALDGPSAIEAARRLEPEFVLLDIGLPGMDGYEVARKLRQEPCCKATVIIAVSGYGQEEDRRRSREAGFDHHLVKPVDFDKLISLMSPAL
jgi:CheY-like chemotaxis protein